MYVQHLAEIAAMDVFHRRDKPHIGAVLRTSLHNTIILAGRLDYFAAFIDIVRYRFFDIHILACLTGPYRH